MITHEHARNNAKPTHVDETAPCKEPKPPSGGKEQPGGPDFPVDADPLPDPTKTGSSEKH